MVAPQAQADGPRAAAGDDERIGPAPAGLVRDPRLRRQRYVLRRSVAVPIPLDELEPRHLEAWRELACRAAEPNPFFEPEFLLPAARHLGGAHFALLVVEGPGREWVACAPVAFGVRLRRARVPVLSVWRNVEAPLGTPLVAGGELERATERLLERAFHVSRVGVVALPWIGDGGPVVAGLLEALEARGGRPAVHRSFERAVIHRATLEAGVEPLLDGRHRRDLRRLARRLEERLEASLEVRDESDRAAAVDRFLALERSGWKGERGTALASDEGRATFFRELCDAFRAAGRLQLLTLGSDDRTVSVKCNLLAGDAVFCFKIAFDESFARFRPGLQLEVRMLEVFRERMSQTWMDSCAAPGSPLFAHLWPDRRRIGSYVVAANRPFAWATGYGASLLVHAPRS